MIIDPDLSSPGQGPRSSGRIPLFAALRRALTLARAANRPGAPPVVELAERCRASRRSRRDLLRAEAAALGLAAAGPVTREA